MKKLLILTGESGSGKSTAVKHLEDLGFYCMDNVPPNLLENIIELINSSPEIERVALVIDVRNPSFKTNAKEVLERIKEKFPFSEVWFFTADGKELIRRFKETRRPHPLERYFRGKGLEKLIEEEKKLLSSVKDLTDKVIDTTSLNVHELKKLIKNLLLTGKPQLKVTVMSFGFKYGLPLTADNVFDVRFLPNPHFVPQLKEKTGKEREVKDYLLKFEETKRTVEYIVNFIKFSLPFYEKEGKSYVTYAIGCTGGQHRSVAVAELVSREVAKGFPNFEVFVEHREQNVREKVKSEENNSLR